MTSPARVAAAFLILALAACASRPPPATPLRPENLFVSPSGEPFHDALRAPYASALWFAQADADHDGRLTRAEFAADADRAFRRYDANGDGVIDGLEIAAYEDKIAPEILPRIAALSAGEGMDPSLFGGRRGGRRSGDGGDARPREPRAGDRQGQGAGIFSLLDEPEPVSAADADLDGKVTLAEWRRRTQRRFDLIADGAEALTLSALPKTAMQRLLERRAGKGDDRPGAPPTPP